MAQNKGNSLIMRKMQPSECIVVSHHKEVMKGRDKEWKYKRKKAPYRALEAFIDAYESFRKLCMALGSQPEKG